MENTTTTSNTVGIAKTMCMDTNINKPRNFITDDGNVYILGDFDATISIYVIHALVSLVNALESQKNPKIHIYINSCGGSAYELFSMLAVLEDAKRVRMQQGLSNEGNKCLGMIRSWINRKYVYSIQNTVFRKANTHGTHTHSHSETQGLYHRKAEPLPQPLS